MSDNLKDILSNLNPDVDQEALMKYLEGKLSAHEQHEVEKQMLGDDFDSDALEGLESFRNKTDILNVVNHLNADLKKRTAKKETRKRKYTLHLNPWIIVAIVIVLAIAVVGYLVIHRLNSPGA